MCVCLLYVSGCVWVDKRQVKVSWRLQDRKKMLEKYLSWLGSNTKLVLYIKVRMSFHQNWGPDKTPMEERPSGPFKVKLCLVPSKLSGIGMPAVDRSFSYGHMWGNPIPETLVLLACWFLSYLVATLHVSPSPSLPTPWPPRLLWPSLALGA